MAGGNLRIGNGSAGLRYAAILVGIICVAGVMPARAAEIEYGIDLGAEYTNNIGLTRDNKQADWIGRAAVSASLKEESRYWSADVSGLVNYEHYFRDTFSDAVLPSLSSAIAWNILPKRFVWHIDDYYQQIQRNATDPQTPANRENTNVFWTGPDLFIPITPIDRFVVAGRYGDVYYSKSDADNRRNEFDLRLVHDLSPVSNVSLNGERLHVNYDRNAFTDYSLYNGYLRYERKTDLSEFHVLGGSTRVTREGQRDLNKYLAGVFWQRALVRDASVGIQILHHYTDSGVQLLQAAAAPVEPDLSTAAVSGDLLYEKLYEVFMTLKPGLWTVTGRLNRYQDNYEVSDLDRVANGGSLDLSYAWSPTFRVDVRSGYRHIDYTKLNRLDREYGAGIGLNQRITARFNLALSYDWRRRKSDLASAEFTENRVFLGLSYRNRL
ncbi:MAG: outer membrane beta-barrel protein [Rhodothermales bacterium]